MIMQICQDLVYWEDKSENNHLFDSKYWTNLHGKGQ